MILMGTWADQISGCNFYCKYTIFGTQLVGINIHIRANIWTNWTTGRLCTLILKSHASNSPAINIFHIVLIIYIFIHLRICIFNANPMVLFSLKSSDNWRSYSMITINQQYPAGFGSSKNSNYIQHYPLPSTHSCLPPIYITRWIVTYIL